MVPSTITIKHCMKRHYRPFCSIHLCMPQPVQLPSTIYSDNIQTYIFHRFVLATTCNTVDWSPLGNANATRLGYVSSLRVFHGILWLSSCLAHCNVRLSLSLHCYAIIRNMKNCSERFLHYVWFWSFFFFIFDYCCIRLWCVIHVLFILILYLSKLGAVYAYWYIFFCVYADFFIFIDIYLYCVRLLLCMPIAMYTHCCVRLLMCKPVAVYAYCCVCR